LPTRTEIDNTLGWIYYKKGLASLAIPSLRLAAEKEPRNAMYQYQLGLAYAKAGDKTHARDALTRALAADPAFPAADDARKTLAAL
jgi:Flp pilus assembly protein TadD